MTIYGAHDDVPEAIPVGYERISLVQLTRDDLICYQVENAEGGFYLCDSDGDQFAAGEWILLRVLADIPDDDDDAFFEAIQASACEES